MRIFANRPTVVDVSAACGKRLSVGELKIALAGKDADLAVRGIMQLIAMSRQDCLSAAQTEAWKAGNPNYHLGGVQALDDLLSEVVKVLAGGEVSDDVKRWFAPEP